MEDRSDRHPPAPEVPNRETYELDMEEHSETEIEEVIQDAMDAVDKDSSPPSDSREASDGSAAESVDTAKLRSEKNALKDRLMRTLADFENYRKRTDREKQALRQMGIFDAVKDFLDVIDNLERALESAGSVDDLKQGVQMILRQQEGVLERHGVEKIKSVGQPFDPTIHEAVGRDESATVEAPTVTAELQKGYLLHDRLLRPAMGQVTMPVTPASGEASSDEDGAAAEEFGEETIWEGDEVESVAD